MYSKSYESDRVGSSRVGLGDPTRPDPRLVLRFVTKPYNIQLVRLVCWQVSPYRVRSGSLFGGGLSVCSRSAICNHRHSIVVRGFDNVFTSVALKQHKRKDFLFVHFSFG